MNKQLLKLVWSLIWNVSFLLLFFTVGYEYVVHDVQPSNMTVLILLTGTIIFTQNKNNQDK
jgi:hypothetical protein